MFVQRGDTARRTVSILTLLALLLTCSRAQADVKLPAIFGDHAVLQRDMKLPVWGWAEPGEAVQVTISNQHRTCTTDADGKWQVTLDPLAVGEPLTMVIVGKNRIELNDLRVGDVWLCSGQSNMEFEVNNGLDFDLEVAAANYPDLRMINVKNAGGQTPQHDFDDHWERCTPETAGSFSAVGYYFGRELLQIERVPIGLIDNSWGGSACEAWIRRDLMEGNPLYEALLKKWDKRIAEFDEQQAHAEFEKQHREWTKAAETARRNGQSDPPGRPEWMNLVMCHIRPANLYNSRICPIARYAIRGAIWYQGETNTDRAYQYREMFPLMITNWRQSWAQGDFPFYWVQLADYRPEKNEPGESDWAELREAQTMALDKLPNTGQAVIVDLGEASDIHPRNKQVVGKRLARLALANTYGRKIAHGSPRYEAMEQHGNSILIRFRGVNGTLRTFDGKPVVGFAIAGSDRKWVWADANIVGDNVVEVRSDAVREPAAVRYAWADNPVCNLYDSVMLPVTPFRTDQWPGITSDAR